MLSSVTTFHPFQVIINTLTGGTTNMLLSCDDPASNERVLVRIYGLKTELFIDRGAEVIGVVISLPNQRRSINQSDDVNGSPLGFQVRNMRLLHSHGLAPPVYLAFRNGLCYGYFKGEVSGNVW